MKPHTLTYTNTYTLQKHCAAVANKYGNRDVAEIAITSLCLAGVCVLLMQSIRHLCMKYEYQYEFEPHTRIDIVIQ